MFTRKWFIQYDKNYKSAYGLMFVNGDNKRAWDIKFNPSDKVSIHTSECFVPVVFGTDLKAVRETLSKLKDDSLIVCFNGKQSDLKTLSESHKSKSGWSFLLLNKGCSHEITTTAHGHRKICNGNHTVCGSIIKDTPTPPAPKPEKKNANVSVQKPSVDKKTDK